MTDNIEALAGLPETSFRWLLESAPDGIFLVDSDGRIKLANTQAEKLFGFSEDELIGNVVEMLIPKRYHDMHVRRREEYRAEPRTRAMGIGLELYGLRRDGTEFPVEISLSPITTEQGLLVMAIVRDITDFKRDHHISVTLQKSLLSQVPEQVGGLRIASSYNSAYTGAQVGGDFFDAFTINDKQVGIVIGDVSGKGIDAAVRTALGKYSLRAYAYEEPSPASVMNRLNFAIHNEVEPESFITLFYGLIDIDKRTLSFANAGHMTPLYLPCSSETVQDLPEVGLPLGVAPEVSYEEHTVDFKKGDRILLYTDGVTDARGSDDFFGMDNLKEFLLTNRNEAPNEFVDHLTDRLKEWSGERLRDDVAMLLVLGES